MKLSNIIAFICGLWLCLLITRCTNKAATEPPQRDTIIDTIKVVKPIAKDSLVTRYKWVNVERVKDTTIVNEVSEVVFDTVHHPYSASNRKQALYGRELRCVGERIRAIT